MGWQPHLRGPQTSQGLCPPLTAPSPPHGTQVLSPLAAGLFHRVIAQSGVITSPILLDSNPRVLAQVCISFTLSHLTWAGHNLPWAGPEPQRGVASRELLAGEEGPTGMKEACCPWRLQKSTGASLPADTPSPAPLSSPPCHGGPL